MFFKTTAFLPKATFLNFNIIHHIVIALKSSIEEVGISFLQGKQNDKVRKDFFLTQNICNWLQDYDKIIKIFFNKILVKAQAVYSARQTCATWQPAELMNNIHIWTNALPTHSLIEHTFLIAWKPIPNVRHMNSSWNHEQLKMVAICFHFTHPPHPFFPQNKLLAGIIDNIQHSAMWQPTDGCISNEFGEVKNALIADMKKIWGILLN